MESEVLDRLVKCREFLNIFLIFSKSILTMKKRSDII